MNAGLYHCIGTRRGAAVVGAGLEIDVQGGASGRVFQAAQSFDFGVRPARLAVEPLADDAPIANDDRTDRRVGARPSQTSGGEFQGPLHIDGVRSVVHPVFLTQG